MGKADRLAGSTRDSSPQGSMFALDLLHVPLARMVLVGIDIRIKGKSATRPTRETPAQPRFLRVCAGCIGKKGATYAAGFRDLMHAWGVPGFWVSADRCVAA